MALLCREAGIGNNDRNKKSVTTAQKSGRKITTFSNYRSGRTLVLSRISSKKDKLGSIELRGGVEAVEDARAVLLGRGPVVALDCRLGKDSDRDDRWI